jgi:WD40 repeat protein
MRRWHWATVAVLGAGLVVGLLRLASGSGPPCVGQACSGASPAASSSSASPAPAAASAWKGWPGVSAVGTLRPAVRVTLPRAAAGSYLYLGVSADGSRLLTVDGGGNVMERNLVTGTATTLPALVAASFSNEINFAATVSPDLGVLASSGGNDVSIQRVASGTDLGDLNVSLPSNGEQPGELVLSPDGGRLAYCDAEGGVRILNVATQSARTVNNATVQEASTLAFSPDGQTLAVGNIDGSITLWAVASGKLLATLHDPGGNGVDALAFGEHGALLAAADDVGNVYLWNFAQRSVAGALPGTPSSSAVNSVYAAFSPDGRLLAVSFSDGSIGVWSVATGTRLADLPGSGDGPVAPVAFGRGGSLLADINGNGGVTEWNLG